MLGSIEAKGKRKAVKETVAALARGSGFILDRAIAYAMLNRCGSDAEAVIEAEAVARGGSNTSSDSEYI